MSENQNEKYKFSHFEDDDCNQMTRYYRTWQEADSVRQKGDRIYYTPGSGYYIVRPQKRSFNPWGNGFKFGRFR